MINPLTQHGSDKASADWHPTSGQQRVLGATDLAPECPGQCGCIANRSSFFDSEVVLPGTSYRAYCLADGGGFISKAVSGQEVDDVRHVSFGLLIVCVMSAILAAPLAPL